jgi:hypothetical protein
VERGFQRFCGYIFIIIGPHSLNHTTLSFQGTFTEADLNLLRASSEIEAIEEDGIVTTAVTQFAQLVCHGFLYIY